MNVVGDPISITNAVVGDYFCYSVVYEGDDGVIEGATSTASTGPGTRST